MYDSASIPSRSILVLLVLGLVLSSYARADSVSATVAAGSAPCAINPATNKIYVSIGGNTVTAGSATSPLLPPVVLPPPPVVVPPLPQVVGL